MRIGPRSLVVGAALAVAAHSPTARAQEPPFTPVTEAMLLDPDPADWINWRRTLDGWGFWREERLTR